jgi:hypothetical protein
MEILTLSKKMEEKKLEKKLSEFSWPGVTKVDLAFSTFKTIPELLELSTSARWEKGRKKFNELFFTGGDIIYEKEVIGSWKEQALCYALVLMRSFEPKHEDKEAVCAMIFEHTLCFDEE